MSADLTRCCCGGCAGEGAGGNACPGCNGSFFPDPLSLTFTPHFSGGWPGQFICIPGFSCCDGEPTPPTGAESGPRIGDYPEWFSAPSVSLTLTADDAGSDCARTYTSNNVTASEPSGLPSWGDNPLGLGDDEDDWCEIETGMQPFAGDNGFWQEWKATLDVEALQCDSSGGGTDTNPMRGRLKISTTHPQGGSPGVVLYRHLVITSSEEGCSCFLVNYGTGDWAAMCPGNDCCGPGLAPCGQQIFALKTDWGGDWGLGSVTQAFESDPRTNDCCEEFDVDWYYIGGTDIEDSVTCPGNDDEGRLGQLAGALHAPVTGPPYTDNSLGCIHYAKRRDATAAAPIDACDDYCQVALYGFALALYPAITDISLATP